MDTYTDRMLECSVCGTNFVWTAAQQRQSATSEAPQRCPVCERQHARVSESAATAQHGSTNVNGNATFQEQQVSVPDLPPHTQENQSQPSDYVSGTGHPLYGHGGERHTGLVKWFNDRKGFGFITLDNGIDIFVHYSGIEGEGYKTLKQGQRVTIEVEDTDKGPQASRVHPMEDEPSAPSMPM